MDRTELGRHCWVIERSSVAGYSATADSTTATNATPASSAHSLTLTCYKILAA